LMDAGLMREGIVANDGLVSLDSAICQLRKQPARRIEFGGVDSGPGLQKPSAYLDRHHNFFESSIAGSLADTVNGAFDLGRSILYTGKRGRDGKSEVIVTVRADRHPIDVLYSSTHIADQPAILFGDAITDSVRDIHDRRPGLNNGFQDAAQIVDLGATGVFGGK